MTRFASILLVLTPLVAIAESPTIARLSFQLDSAHMAAFATVYESEVVPRIERFGWKAAEEDSRPSAEGFFCRLFEFDSLPVLGEAVTALEEDEDWRSMLEDFAARFDTEKRQALPSRLAPYRATLEVVRRVPARPGVTSTATFQTGHWTSFDETDGLAAMLVWRIIQDRDGSLWFATYKGLSSFDGRSWTMYTVEDGLPDNSLRSVFQDRDGSLWLGTTSDGVCRFDPSPHVTDRCETWAREDGLAGNHVGSIVQDRNGFLWFGTDRGVSRVQPSGLTTAALEFENYGRDEGIWGDIHDGLVDRDGTVWFGGNEGLFRFDGRRFTRLTSEDGLPHDQVWALLEDRDGALWIGTAEGAARYDGRTFTTFTLESGLAHDGWIPDIAQDATGRLWFATYGDASRFDGTSFKTFDTSSGLAANSVRSILPDREGNLWFGLFGGTTRYTPDGFALLDGVPDPAGGEGPPTVLRASSGADGDLLLALDLGYSRYRNGELTTYDLSDVIDADRPSLYDGPGDDDWIGGGKSTEIARSDGEQWSVFTVSHMPTNLWPTLRDRAGALWLRSNIGLVRLSGDELTYYGREDGLVTNRARRVVEGPDGRLWINNWRGVSVHDPGMGSSGVFASPVEKMGISEIHQILTDRAGNLWVAGLGGLSRFDGTTWRRFTTRDGLAGSRVFRIVERRNGQLWFTTTAGLGLFDGHTFQKMTTAEGLPWNDPYALAEDGRGQIWLQNNGQAVRYQPPPAAPPTVAIHAVVAERRHTEVSHLELPSTAGVIAFEYGGVSLRPAPLVYRYRLHGFDEEWHNTRDRRVEYHDLPTGDFSFEVLAVDQDLLYSEQPATVSLTVHLPYERLVLGFALAVAAALVVWQTGRVIRRGRRLGDSNQALSDAVNELFDANKALERDKAVAGIRVEVQSMERAADFVPVLSEVTRDLAAVGIGFEDCEIDVLDEPVERPTMAYFEEHGFRYTTYRLDPDGEVTSNSYAIAAPFPTVNLETIERFVAGEPWRGSSGDRSIVEVPAASYGRLRISSSQRTFTDEHLETLQDFAAAIALGYARYLDIKQIQEATERKSAFLASMSHELRTPMNAIKGFVNLVRRREEGLSDRGRQNLDKVNRASDHLLAMINDLLDLSKIEAGRMEVNARSFDIAELVEGAAATVSPLLKDLVSLAVEIDPDIGEASTDDARLRQMTINLLSNAVKFTDHGSVTVAAHRETADGVKQTTGETLVIRVADTGQGIPDGELPTIFDEYRQVRGSSESTVQRGTGLGLSITRKFAELLGGAVQVESTVGEGSTFTIKVPVAHATDTTS